MRKNNIMNDALKVILEFKKQKNFKKKYLSEENGIKLLEDLPIKGMNLQDVVDEFNSKYLPYCTNDSSPNNMGFPDSGNSDAGMIGTLYAEFLHQNLINQSGSSPSVTFSEINVIRWIREIVGYSNIPYKKIKSISDVGGIVDFGGTMSNCIAMMLARESHVKNTLFNGVKDPNKYKVLLPEGIEHYSIRSSLMWLGLGDNVINVKTRNFKMDLDDLKLKLEQNKENIMACIVYAGDSRSMTIDNLPEVYRIVKSFNENIWCHVDACHGFSLGFSNKLKIKIKGIELYDSITIDAHKVLMLPYGLSMILTKNPHSFDMIKSESDLIMKEKFAFGQITPFIGSKNATSLKLWFLMKNLGKEGIGKIVEKRYEMAKLLEKKLNSNPNFIVLNDVQINSVMFLMINDKNRDSSLTEINEYNKKIYDIICHEGKYYLHNFPIKIPNNKFNYDGVFTPLRYMSGNYLVNEKEIDLLIEYLEQLNKKMENIMYY